MFAADIYCHGSCIKSYLLKYERRNLKNSSITSRLYTAIELRLWTHLFGTGKKNFENLPPTSRSIKEHILRAYFYTHVQTNCLAPNNLEVDPSKFGNEIVENYLIPKKGIKLYPDEDDKIFALKVVNH